MTDRREPLFHPRTIAQYLKTAPVPEDLEARRALLQPWIDDASRGTIDRKREVGTDTAFLEVVFGQVLGYRTLSHRGAAATWDLDAHTKPGRGGKEADGAIGWFSDATVGATPKLHAVVELKRSTQDLDVAGGRTQTPVEQAWGYAFRNQSVRWILVSNFRETRLYCKQRTVVEFERFKLTELGDPDVFRRFWLMLSRQNLLPDDSGGTTLLDRMLADSDKAQKDVTDELYGKYSELRDDIFHDLCRAFSHRPKLELVPLTQKLMDRALFIAFAEDRKLLPEDSLQNALTPQQGAFVDVPAWASFTALCRKIDKGDKARRIPHLNGGLFAHDPNLDELDVPDDTCRRLLALGEYDFAEDVSVEVLGHIFEQSISDLERLRAEARGDKTDGVGARKKQGVFYTPSFVTRFIVRETIGRSLEERLTECRAEAGAPVTTTDSSTWTQKQRNAALNGWELYRRALLRFRVLDPACGSGAFLAAAFELLSGEYRRADREMAALMEGGSAQEGLIDVDGTVLNHNLFGVDLSRESVEVTMLSLWLKTATAARPLTWLDGNVQCGDSIVDDPGVSPLAFDWSQGNRAKLWFDGGAHPKADEIHARWRDKFDAVIGNPPYVRQEWISEIKPHLKAHYDAYDGVADLFVYFFERGLKQLAPGGRLGFVVANKWLKGGYAEPLRRMLTATCDIEQVIDFGHAPIFPDADAFPSILILRKRQTGDVVDPARNVWAVQFPREELGRIGVDEFVLRRRVPVPQSRLKSSGWSLEPPAVEALMEKIRRVGVPLGEGTGIKPFYGVKTGYNDAFLIDQATRDRLLAEDRRSDEIIKPYLRGQDVQRWTPDWDGQFMIFTRRGLDINRYPAILRRLEGFRKGLEPKPLGLNDPSWAGRKSGSYAWYEIQDSVDYYAAFGEPKLVYQVIQFHPRFAIDWAGALTNDKAFILPTSSEWLLATLNSPLMWWHNFRYLPHMKDEALTPLGVMMEKLPIAAPNARQLSESGMLVPEIVTLAAGQHQARRQMLEWLRHEFDIDTPGNALSAFGTLSADAFVAEVKKRRPKAKRFTPADVKLLTDTHAAEAKGWRERARRTLEIERVLSDLVLDAYQLTPAERALLARTAPPRMPPGLPDGAPV